MRLVFQGLVEHDFVGGAGGLREGMMDVEMGLGGVQLIVDELKMFHEAAGMGEGFVEGKLQVGEHVIVVMN